jgi:hypothetical protein
MKKEILTRIYKKDLRIPVDLGRDYTEPFRLNDIIQVNLPGFPTKSLYLQVLKVLETTEDYYFVKAISCDTESEVYDNKPVIPLRREYTRYFQKLKKKERKKIDANR